MTTVGELSATATLSVFAAVIVLCCCFYYFLSKKQRDMEEPPNSKKKRRSFLTSTSHRAKCWFSPFASARSICSPSSSHAQLSGAFSGNTSPQRSISTCSSQQTLNLGELIRAMEDQEKHEIRGDLKNYANSSAYKLAILMPGTSATSIQEKQERFHRWLSTPSCHLQPIKEEPFPTSSSIQIHISADDPSGKNQCQCSPVHHHQSVLAVPVYMLSSPKRSMDVIGRVV